MSVTLPHNPTGVTMDETDLRDLVAQAAHLSGYGEYGHARIPFAAGRPSMEARFHCRSTAPGGKAGRGYNEGKPRTQGGKGCGYETGTGDRL